MRIIGIDLGEKRIGVAMSDELGIIAQPLTTIQRGSFPDDCAALDALVKQYAVERIVMGLPLHMSGESGDSSNKSLKYGKKLEGCLGIPVVFWDERLTTVAAERSLLECDMRRGRRKTVIDMVAASLILDGYLRGEQLRQGSEK